MKWKLFALAVVFMSGCSQESKDSNTSNEPFPPELVEFKPYPGNPVFSGTGEDTWDRQIRERGYILKEGAMFFMWYTGYRSFDGDTLKLGYATSKNGIDWIRYDENPIYSEKWTEDMMVLKVEDTYYMFAEGRNDIAHMLTSTDRIHWQDHGSLDIRYVNGEPLSEGPYGTPTAWLEDGIWYLLYERNDEAIWLASSEDTNVWTNVQDDPVIEKGPEGYDKYGLAVNQVIKYKGWYYAYYHGTPKEDWSDWNTNVAASRDLIHWEKYPGNPILEENKSSGILVYDGEQYRLYTMHPQVALHFHELQTQ